MSPSHYCAQAERFAANLRRVRSPLGARTRVALKSAADESPESDQFDAESLAEIVTEIQVAEIWAAASRLDRKREQYRVAIPSKRVPDLNLPLARFMR